MTRTLHIHEPRIGVGMPARTVRPWRRSGDAILESFLAALADPAEEIVLSGRLFDRADPPAHLADRVVGKLRECVRSGLPVCVPPDVPRGLLFLSAGVLLREAKLPGRAPEFWQAGAYRILEGEVAETRRVPLPGILDLVLDVTGHSAFDVHARLRSRLARAGGARFVRVVLTGETEDHEVARFGNRELHQHLPAGVQGLLTRELSTHGLPARPATGEDRLAALTRARSALPELPTGTGVYELLDSRERVLYIGKAVDIRRRVASHFSAEAREESPRGPMLRATRSVRTTLTGSEVEALLHEARRIREARPPYNRQMKSHESYRYLRATVRAPLPTLSSAMVTAADGAVYYGPFPKRWVVERAVRVLQVVYGLANCAWRPGTPAPEVCTDRDLGICSAPCRARITLDGYCRRVYLALDHLLDESQKPPPFGTLNAPSAGLLTREDLGILAGFGRSLRRILDRLRNASGGVRLPDGRVLLVLGGLLSGERHLGSCDEDEVREWVDRRVREFDRYPSRTWVTAAQADELRILSHALRRHPFALSGDRGRDGLDPRRTRVAGDRGPREDAE